MGTLALGALQLPRLRRSHVGGDIDAEVGLLAMSSNLCGPPLVLDPGHNEPKLGDGCDAADDRLAGLRFATCQRLLGLLQFPKPPGPPTITITITTAVIDFIAITNTMTIANTFL